MTQCKLRGSKEGYSKQGKKQPKSVPLISRRHDTPIVLALGNSFSHGDKKGGKMRFGFLATRKRNKQLRLDPTEYHENFFFIRQHTMLHLARSQVCILLEDIEKTIIPRETSREIWARFTSN